MNKSSAAGPANDPEVPGSAAALPFLDWHAVLLEQQQRKMEQSYVAFGNNEKEDTCLHTCSHRAVAGVEAVSCCRPTLLSAEQPAVPCRLLVHPLLRPLFAQHDPRPASRHICVADRAWPSAPQDRCGTTGWRQLHQQNFCLLQMPLEARLLQVLDTLVWLTLRVPVHCRAALARQPGVTWVGGVSTRKPSVVAGAQARGP